MLVESGLASGPPQVDYVMNGMGGGDVAATLLNSGFDVNLLRPYIGHDNRSYVDRVVANKRRAVPVRNAATLRYDEWKAFDTALLETARAELEVFNDLLAAGLTYGGFNAMGSTVLMYQDVGEINAATISMDGLREGDSDQPEFDTKYLPLPIIHKDWHLSARDVNMSRTLGAPLDTTIGEMAAIEVADYVEQMTLGTLSSYSFGGGTIYGYTNFPKRLTKTDITPGTDGGWTGAVLVNEIIAMKALAIAKFHRGPFFCYMGTNWTPYLDQDYSASKGSNTVRERIAAIEGIDSPKIIDRLSGWDILLVEKKSRTVRAINGMATTTIQWESNGGMRLNFKTMAILVPQLRADQNDQCGIVHGSTS